MKLLIEVVATNMETGHVAINQHSVEITSFNGFPPSEKRKKENDLFENLKKSNYFKPSKVGPILIDRSLLAIA